MVDTLLIAGFEVEDSQDISCIPDEWEIVDSFSTMVKHFLVHSPESGKIYLASSVLRIKSGKRVNTVDLIKLADDDASGISTNVKAAVNRLSPWGYDTEQGIFNIPYRPESVKFYKWVGPKVGVEKVTDNNNNAKIPCIPQLPTVYGSPMPYTKPAPKMPLSELIVTPWDASKSLYCHNHNGTKFILKQIGEDIMVVGVEYDSKRFRIPTPTEASEARELGLEVGMLD